MKNEEFIPAKIPAEKLIVETESLDGEFEEETNSYKHDHRELTCYKFSNGLILIEQQSQEDYFVSSQEQIEVAATHRIKTLKATGEKRLFGSSSAAYKGRILRKIA